MAFTKNLKLGDFFEIRIYPHNPYMMAKCVVVNIDEQGTKVIWMSQWGDNFAQTLSESFIDSAKPVLLGKARPRWWWCWLPRFLRKNIFPFTLANTQS